MDQIQKQILSLIGEARWQFIRRYYPIALIRSSLFWVAAMPIAIKVMEDLPDQIEISFGTDKVYELTLALPFTWWVLWAASFSYLLSYSIFALFCPEFIKRYGSYSDYLVEGHSPRWLPWVASKLFDQNMGRKKFVKRLTDKGYLVPSERTKNEVAVEDRHTVWVREIDGSYFEFSMPRYRDGELDDDLTDTANKEVFWEVFARYADSRFCLRWLCKTLVGISLAAFAWVVLQNLWFVFGIVF